MIDIIERIAVFMIGTVLIVVYITFLAVITALICKVLGVNQPIF